MAAQRLEPFSGVREIRCVRPVRKPSAPVVRQAARPEPGRVEIGRVNVIGGVTTIGRVTVIGRVTTIGPSGGLEPRWRRIATTSRSMVVLSRTMCTAEPG